jgi:hypothetical protein
MVAERQSFFSIPIRDFTVLYQILGVFGGAFCVALCVAGFRDSKEKSQRTQQGALLLWYADI